MRKPVLRKIGAFVFLLATLGAGEVSVALEKDPSLHHSLKLQSSAFKDGGPLPDLYTCHGKNISPELDWKGAPEGTKSFVLICEDPDAPSQVWIHWVVYDIPANVYELTEDFPKDPLWRNGIRQGTNDFRKVGYGGPCPPSGTHRYYFKLYALDKMLELAPGAMKIQVEKEMKGHILAFTQIMGLYGL